MGVKNIPAQTMLTCDKCGHEHREEMNRRAGLPPRWTEIRASRHEDWSSASEHIILCPKCRPPRILKLIKERDELNDRYTVVTSPLP